MLADFTKSFLKLPRSFCLPLIACIFIISQITCYYVEDVGALWKASALLGAAYGAMFGLFPTIVIEWFGLRAFISTQYFWQQADRFHTLVQRTSRKIGGSSRCRP